MAGETFSGQITEKQIRYNVLNNTRTDRTTPAAINRRLAMVVAYAAQNSPFFAEKYEGLTLPHGVEDLPGLPVLTKHELHEVVTKQGLIENDLFTRFAGGGIDFLSGGTTDHQTAVTFDWSELYPATQNIHPLQDMVFEPGDRAVIMSGQYAMWGGFPLNYMVWGSNPNIRALPMGNAGGDQVVRTFERYKPTIVAGLSKSILTGFRALSEHKVDVGQVRYVQFAGMPLTQHARDEITDIVGHDVRYVSHYTGSESWATGYSVDPDRPSHLYLSNNAVVEVVHPDTMQPIPEGEVGSVLITRLTETLQPVIRYAIGDTARIVPAHELPPGRRMYRHARVIELYERRREIILAGLKLNPDVMSRVFTGALPGALNTQFVRSMDDGTEVFEVVVEANDPQEMAERYPEQERVIREIFHEYMPDYPVSKEPGANDILAELSLRMKFVGKGELELTAVGKDRTLIDKREKK